MASDTGGTSPIFGGGYKAPPAAPAAPTIPVGDQRLAPAGNGYVAVQMWDGSQWITIDYSRDYGTEDAYTASRIGGGGGGGAGPQAYGSTQEGFMAQLGLQERELTASIEATKQRLQEIQMQEDGATGRLFHQLSTERDNLQQQLTYDREQLAENRRQFDSELELSRTLGLGNLGVSQGRLSLDTLLGTGQLDLANRQQTLDELLGKGQLELGQGRLGLDAMLGQGQLDLAAMQAAQGYEIDLKQLDIQGQGLAIQARKAELDAQVAQGTLDNQKAQMQLEREIATGRLQLDRESLAQNQKQFAANLSLQTELGRAQAANDSRLAAVQEGRLGLDTELGRGRLALDSELGRGELKLGQDAEARMRKALYTEQFGKDPVRQALLALKMEGGTTPQELQFRDQGLRTGGGQLRDMQPQPTNGAVLVGEQGPEVMIPQPGGATVLPITHAAADGGTFTQNLQRGQRKLNYGVGGAQNAIMGIKPPAPAAANDPYAVSVPTPTVNPNIAKRQAQIAGNQGSVGGVATPTPTAPRVAQDPQIPVHTDYTDTQPVPAEYQSDPNQTAILTARALERALKLRQGQISIDESTGVSGLVSPEQAARNYLESGLPVQNLITDAYSVGGVSGGVNPDEFRRRVLDVTPRGSLSY